MKERESNIELFRCILTIGVLVLHYNNDTMGGAFAFVKDGSFNQFVLMFLESCFSICVNCFILITGYCNTKKTKVNLKKPILLLLSVVFYNLISFIGCSIINMSGVSIRSLVFCLIPKNWYITLYIALLFFAPYINKLIHSLNESAAKKLAGIMIIFCSAWPTILELGAMILGVEFGGLNTVSMSGTSSGYSIVNFVMLYLMGAVIRKCNLFNHNKWIDLALYGAFSIIIFLWSLLFSNAWSYSNLLVVISAIALFNFFRKIKVQSKGINIISKNMLGVYLLHTEPLIIAYFWKIFRIPETVNLSIGKLLLNLIMCVSATFVICVIVDCGLQKCMKFLNKKLDNFNFVSRDIVDIK